MRRFKSSSTVYSSIVQDEAGRILGKVTTTGRELIREEVAFVRNFLCGLYGETKTNKENQMGNPELEQCNIVALCGTIKTIKVTKDEGRAFFLLNPGGDTKFIPCTVHKDEELLDKLARFQKNDSIKFSGFIRAWSQKKDDVWTNHCEVRVTSIKNEAPRRAAPTQRKLDSDIPDEYR